MKADAHKQVQYLRHGMEQFLADEDKHIANGAPRLRGEQYFALGALTKLSDTQIAASYYKLPTGFGKTVMFSYMAQAYLLQARANGDTKKLVILVPRLNLINQTSDKLDSFAGFSASEFSGRTKDTDADIIISTYHSLDKLVETIGIENIGLIFADEAHHATGDKISQTMLDLIKSVPTIGFTATPSYDADKSVSNVLRTEIFAMTIADGVRSGMLSPVKNTLYCSSIVYDLENAPATSQGEYDYNSITGQIDTDTLTSEIADIYINGVDEDTGRRFIDAKAMINCPNIEMAKRQADAINQRAGRIIARAFSSDMKDFEIEKAKFIAGKYQVACQVNTMTEGFDDTTVSLCINYPTRSAVRAEQAAGRAIRLNESDPHKIAFVIDTIFRKHDSETSDTALQTARHAKQVLFKDIAGEMVLFPENFKDGITHGRHRPHTRGNHETIKPYEIITSTETLLDLNHVDTERAKEEEIPEKTDEWLGALELTKFFEGNRTKMIEKLKEYKDKMNGQIQLRKSKNNKFLCLHIDAIDKFAEISGLIKIGEFSPKTEEWLSASDIVEYVRGRKDKTRPVIAEHLKTLHAKMPDKIQYKMAGGNKVLCLHITAVDEFIEKSGLIGRNSIPEKTPDWLTASELCDYFVGHTERTHPIIVAKLEELKDKMPDKIQKRIAGTRTSLCLHISAIDEFANQINLERKVISSEKTSDWLSATELRYFIEGNPNKMRGIITSKLIELQNEMPNEIQYKSLANGNKTLCLHVKAIDSFIEKAGFAKRLDTADKGEWLGPSDLGHYFSGKKHKLIKIIAKKLAELHDIMPDKIQLKKSANGKISYRLHISAIDEFAKLAELKRRNPEKYEKKTDDWLAPIELMNYFYGTTNEISDKLYALRHKLQGKIEYRISANGKTSLCLHNSAIDEFAQLSKMQKRGNCLKTNDWLSATEIAKLVYGDENQNRVIIGQKLIVLQREMPDRIQVRKPKTGKSILCLHVDALDEFISLLKLEKKVDLPKKTSEWLNARELTQYFAHTRELISEKLVALAKKMPGKIEERQAGTRKTLCLHRDALDEFARLSGLKRRGEVTPEKFHAGTKVVKAMIQMAESKKQTKDTITPDNQYE